MTITQLEYTIAVATYESFVAAAEKCFVTQPTLSMQIAKLEEELGVKIFNRNKQPISLTEVGVKIVEQARKAISESGKINEIVREYSGIQSGKFTIAVIPTIAPYVVPKLVANFATHNPNIELVVREMQTATIVEKLIDGSVDCGLLSTPLDDVRIIEYPLFEEPLVIYFHQYDPLLQNKTVKLSELKMENIWMMNEGNCLRNQVFNLCSDQLKSTLNPRKYNYESGNLSTLRQMVSLHGGFTIMPELVFSLFCDNEIDRIRYFEDPVPVREVSLITSQHFVKKAILKILMKEVLDIIPEQMKLQKTNRKVLRIQTGH